MFDLFVVASRLEGEELLEQGGEDGGFGLAVTQWQPQWFQYWKAETKKYICSSFKIEIWNWKIYSHSGFKAEMQKKFAQWFQSWKPEKLS